MKTHQITVTTVPTSIGSCIKVGPLFTVDDVPSHACIYLDNIRPDEMPGSLLGQQALSYARKCAVASEMYVALEKCKSLFLALGLYQNEADEIDSLLARARGEL